MFVTTRETVLATIKFMGGRVCAYGKGERWPEGRCDCKYGIGGRRGEWPTASEEGTGCPELASLYSIVEAMTNQEWDVLIARGGHAPSGLRWSHQALADARQGLQTATDALSAAQVRLSQVVEAFGDHEEAVPGAAGGADSTDSAVDHHTRPGLPATDLPAAPSVAAAVDPGANQ